MFSPRLSTLYHVRVCVCVYVCLRVCRSATLFPAGISASTGANEPARKKLDRRKENSMEKREARCARDRNNRLPSSSGEESLEFVRSVIKPASGVAGTARVFINLKAHWRIKARTRGEREKEDDCHSDAKNPRANCRNAGEP